MTEIDRLLELAEKATPGPWKWSLDRHGYPESVETHDGKHLILWAGNMDNVAASQEDAEYIVACDPQTIKALIQMVKENQR